MHTITKNWSCQRCTLINRINETKCRACQFECPSISGRSGFLQKIKFPRISLNSALERVDNAIDFVASAIVPKNGQNVQFYQPPAFLRGHPQPRADPAFSTANPAFWVLPMVTLPQPKLATWACPNCAQLNPASVKKCSWCETDRVTDVTISYWCCSNQRCALRQPFPPSDLKCPLCRTKTSALKSGCSKSMPQLSRPQTNVLNPSDYGPVEECQILTHTSTYRDILRFCENNRQGFVDDSFPHSNRSIGTLSQLERRDLSIVWLRPEQIVTRDNRLSRWSVFNDPQPTDIEQGLLGNCWLLSALAVISERPDILEKLFITKEYTHHGVYEVRLCIDGIWQHILVDDFFPCQKRSRQMVFAVGRKNQLWVSLIEKALAKTYGNYAILKAGRTVEGLSTLTGSPTLSIDLEYVDLDRDSRNAALDIAWAKLISAREARFLMGCSCGAGKRTVDEAEYRQVGLMSQHAYSLLDKKHTNREWPGWTQRLRRELPSGANLSAGTFWMPFERFVLYFDNVDIAQTREHSGGWVATRYLVDIGWDQQNSSIIRLTITEPTELCATLFQHNARTALDQVDIMLLLHKQEGEITPGELICRSARKIAPIVRTDDTFLLLGEYLLCVHSFSKFGDQMMPGTIVVHSSRKIFIEKLPTTFDSLHRSMCSLMLKEGVVQKSCSGTVSRYLTNEFAGLALMVDNHNVDCCMQVKSDCQSSTNVLSTRSSLLTVDSIPPLHRQIVALLTHFEPSQAFMNFPPLQTEAVGHLHGPSPIYK
uniref:Calpain-D n=1 Tax=Globodera rostochiensis TaxID=31243 RepID=A0A914HVM4_GLORO